MKLLAEITKDCLDLPSSQRLKLARILIDVSQSSEDFCADSQQAWEQEIAARIEAVKNVSAHARSVEDAFKDLDARYPA